MVDEGSTDGELYDMNDILDGLDPNLINVLRQFGEIDDAEVEVDFVDNFTKEEISDARNKIFVAAKIKAARCLHQPNAGGIFGPEGTEHGLLSREAIDQWELIIRRKKHNFAKDAIELLAFSLDHVSRFPAKLVKCLSMNKGNFESIPEAEDDAITKLSNDIELTGGKYSVEIVNTIGNAETHLITASPNDPPHSVDSDGDSSSESTDIVDTGEEINETERDSTRDKHTDRRPGDPLFDLVEKFVEMSERMMNTIGDRDMTAKSAYQYHWEYIEKMAMNTENRVKEVLEWQKTVNKRLDDLERGEMGGSRRKDMANKHVDDDDDEDERRNEPPVDAVSQRVTTASKKEADKKKHKNSKPTVSVSTTVRKEYPPPPPPPPAVYIVHPTLE